MKLFTITCLLILTIFGSTGLAVEEYVLTLAGQEVRFTAVPEEGFVQRTEDGGQRTEVKKNALHSSQLASAKISYRAPLFSVNGQKVGVTPEVVVRVTGKTSQKELESICKRADRLGIRLDQFRIPDELIPGIVAQMDKPSAVAGLVAN